MLLYQMSKLLSVGLQSVIRAETRNHNLAVFASDWHTVRSACCGYLQPSFLPIPFCHHPRRHKMRQLTLPFSLRGVGGTVKIEAVRNENPSRWGCDIVSPDTGTQETAKGFPVITAEVLHATRGYGAAMGWIQFVKSTDASDPEIFELDPIPVFSDMAMPFTVFGQLPMLFDAPFRDSVYEMRWEARSYLCILRDGLITKKVLPPLVAFSWGFRRDVNGAIEIESIEPLEAQVWEEHLPLLQKTFPGWQFEGGAQG